MICASQTFIANNEGKVPQYNDVTLEPIAITMI
jgi:hypothetical protein